MSIEPEAQKDLSLSSDDAENVVGGQKKQKKQAHKQSAAHHAASNLIVVNMPPMGADSGPEPDAAAQSDDPDC